MGTHLHQAIIVTGPQADVLRAHEEAVRIFSAENPPCYGSGALRLLVGGVTSSLINGFLNFIIYPDGSKLWWPEAEAADSVRDKFMAWLEQQRYEDGSHSLKYVRVQFGGDDAAAAVLASSDAKDER